LTILVLSLPAAAATSGEKGIVACEDKTNITGGIVLKNV
jgi:hypothetical protein